MFYVLVKPLFATFTAESAFPIAAKSGRRIKQIGAVDPDRSRFDFCGDVECQIDVFTPDRRGQTVAGVVGQRHCLGRKTKRHRHDYRPKNFLLEYARGGQHVGHECRGDKIAGRWELTRRLVQLRTLGHTGFDPLFYCFFLPLINHRPHVDIFVERMTHSQFAHPGFELGVKFFSDGFLHQQP